MPAGDGHRVALLDDRRDLGPVLGERGAVGAVAAGGEVLPHPGALGEVPVVERADGVDGGVRLLGEDVVGGRALADDVLGVEVVLEPDAVEVLPVPKHLLALAVRGLERDVDAEDLLRPRVELEVHRPAAEVLGEILVLRLALLPAGRDDGNATLDPELGHRLAEGRVEALRSKKDDGARRHRGEGGP